MNKKLRMNSLLLIVSFIMLIFAPVVVQAAAVDIDGSLQVSGNGNTIIFPDSSTQSGTTQVKFIIAVVGIYPSPSGGTSYSDQILGEVRMFAGNFAPAGWDFCNGQLLPISQNEALFTLLGTTYGGDGVTTFAPNFNNRAPVGY